jgi:uncharacterized membrane protein HdeD (DUF308 family)
MLFANPGTVPELTHNLSRKAAERIAGNWWKLLLNGLVLVVAGVLIFSIDWSVRSLSTFLGALFIVQGISYALTTGIDARVSRTNVVTGLLSAAAGVLIILWPSPGLTALGVVLGAWLIVIGTISIAGAFAVRKLMPDWYLLLIMGLLEIPLGVLALANPGGTLAAFVTVGGIYAVAIGVMQIISAFQLKHLPDDVDKAFRETFANGASAGTTPAPAAPASPVASAN